MADKRIAFLMPVYPPHYDYARGFLRSFRKYKLDRQADIWFVFSNEADRVAFAEVENAIIMPAHLQDLSRDNGVINAKKFYGLSRIKDKYEYVIVVDADMQIMKNIYLHKVCEDIFSRKTLWGNTRHTGEHDKIYFLFTSACREFFADANKINDSRLGLWFNNLCVYKTDTLDDFFAKTGIMDKLKNLIFWHFDHYIYMYYLLIYQGFHTEQIFPLGVFAEYRGSLVNKEYKEKYLHMATRHMYEQIKKLGGGVGCFMFIHLDRPVPENDNKNFILRVIRQFAAFLVPIKKWLRKVRGRIK